MFTDIVGSTEMTARLGDAAAFSKLDKHNKKSGTRALATQDAFAMAPRAIAQRPRGRRDALAGSMAPMRLSILSCSRDLGR
jgi:hypothetical protein